MPNRPPLSAQFKGDPQPLSLFPPPCRYASVTRDSALSVRLNHEERHAERHTRVHPHTYVVLFLSFLLVSLALSLSLSFSLHRSVVPRSFRSRHARSPNRSREEPRNAPPPATPYPSPLHPSFPLFSHPRLSPGHPRRWPSVPVLLLELPSQPLRGGLAAAAATATTAATATAAAAAAAAAADAVTGVERESNPPAEVSLARACETDAK